MKKNKNNTKSTPLSLSEEARRKMIERHRQPASTSAAKERNRELDAARDKLLKRRYKYVK